MSFFGPTRRKSVTIIPQTGDAELLGSFTFDAVTSATETRSGSVFRHPIQQGIEGITDAVRRDPPTFECDGVVSDNPTDFLTGDVFGGPTDRAISLYDHLIELRAAEVPLTILTSWRPPMFNRWPPSIVATRTSETGAAIEISITFERLRIAQVGVVPSQVDSAILLLAQQEVDVGVTPIS